MKKYSFLVIFPLFVLNARAQDFLISFSGAGASNTVETVKVENLTQGITLTLPGSQTLHLKGNNSAENSKNNQKNASLLNETIMPFNFGNRLKFTGSSGNYSTIIMDFPRQVKNLTFNFIGCVDGSKINYPVVQIGNQVWMAENLKTNKLNDGSAIPLVTKISYFSGYYKPAFCVYEILISNYNTYGALYDWELVWTGKLCPAGWHVPSVEEWATLFDRAGGARQSGGVLKETGNNHWIVPNENAIDSLGFCALPGGANFNETDGYKNIRNNGFWWTSDVFPQNMSNAYYVLMSYNSPEALFGANLKNVSSSVRCLCNEQFPTYHSFENVSVCEGSAFKGWVAEGQYSQKFTSVLGYDSIVTTNLTLHKMPYPEILILDDTLISANTYQDYHWFDESGEISGANGNRYVINKTGRYYLVVTNENGCTRTSDTAYVYYSSATLNLMDDFKYSITPNPNNGKFSFRIGSTLSGEVYLKLMNSTGQILETKIVYPAEKNCYEEFDVSQFSKGIYYLIISKKAWQRTEKIVVW